MYIALRTLTCSLKTNLALFRASSELNSGSLTLDVPLGCSRRVGSLEDYTLLGQGPH